MRTRSILLYALLAFLAASAIGLVTWQRHRVFRSLPYQDEFARHEAEEWIPLGGYWNVNQGEMINRSDEAGAKLVTGSPQWTDYAVDVDLELRAHGGDVGTMLRVNDPEVGINAYRGYYVGLRTVDSAVVIGRAEDDWLEGRAAPMSGGVQVGVWYHMTAIVVGCEIAVRATNLSNNQATFAAFRDDPRRCIRAGRIGLRSTDTSGAWKNVRARLASKADFENLSQRASFIGQPDFPVREDDFSRMRLRYFPDYPHLGGDIPLKTSEAFAKLPLESAESLQTHSYAGEEIRVTGSVIFTDPIYLEDSTGGVILQTTNPDSLNIGDEVELVGQSVSSGLSPVFAVSRVHLLRDRMSVSPVSITATEAASGAHSGTLVEVTGTLRERVRLGDGSIVLELTDPAQKFAALLKGDLFNGASRNWSVGSTIRVRGVCTMNPEAPLGRSFTVLVASVSDVSVIAGPPWWSGWRLVRTVGLVLFAGIICIYIFFRLEHSKHRAVLQEREQLAHEMHDTLAQSLAGVGYYLQSIRRSLRNVPQLPGDVMSEFDVACKMVTETHREASASIAALHPERGDESDLLALLERSTFTMLGGRRIPITLRREGDPRPISPAVADVLFQVGREAISNVLRHSQATILSLGLCFQPKWVTLSIDDDGVGFDPGVGGRSFGFQSMQRRCRTVGADLAVRSKPGAGCSVTIQAPTRAHRAFGQLLLRVLGLVHNRDQSSSKRTSPC